MILLMYFYLTERQLHLRYKAKYTHIKLYTYTCLAT